MRNAVRHTLTLAATLLLGACLDSPEPARPDTSASDTTDTTATDTTATDTTATDTTTTDTDVVTPAPMALASTLQGTRMSVHNDAFTLGFSQASGYLPDRLVNNVRPDENLVFGDTDIHEVFVGLSLFDIFHVWQNIGLPVIDLAGPALVALHKDWTFGAEDRNMQGHTWMTIHADGRIYLAFDFSTNFQADGATLVAYAALDISRFSRVFVGPSTSSALPSGNATAAEPWFSGIPGVAPYLCATNEINGDTVGWINRQITASPIIDERITEFVTSTTADASVRLQYDFWTNGTPAGTYAGRFLLGFDASGSCGRIGQWADAFHSPPTMSVSSGVLDGNADGDSDHDGFNDRGGYYSIDADGARAVVFQLAEAVQSLSLRIHGTPSWGAPTVTVGALDLIDPGQNMVWQAQDSNGGWLVMNARIPARTAITIAW